MCVAAPAQHFSNAPRTSALFAAPTSTTTRRWRGALLTLNFRVTARGLMRHTAASGATSSPGQCRASGPSGPRRRTTSRRARCPILAISTRDGAIWATWPRSGHSLQTETPLDATPGEASVLFRERFGGQLHWDLGVRPGFMIWSKGSDLGRKSCHRRRLV